MRGAKLDWIEVEEMRGAYEKGETQASLCRRFGVSLQTVGRIVRRESWQGENAAPSRLPLKPGRPRELDDPEAILQRLLKVQEEYNAKQAPSSLLDGADLTDETNGSGLVKLSKTLREMKDEGTL